MCERVVEAQRAHLAWTQAHLPPECWLEAISDGTQAVCWRVAGRDDEWEALFDETLATTPVHEGTRWTRFVGLHRSGGRSRPGSTGAGRNGARPHARADHGGSRLGAQREVIANTLAIRIGLRQAQGRAEEIPAIADEATAPSRKRAIRTMQASPTGMSRVPSWTCASLLRGRPVAKALHRACAVLPLSLFSLALCLWTLTKDRGNGPLPAAPRGVAEDRRARPARLTRVRGGSSRSGVPQALVG